MPVNVAAGDLKRQAVFKKPTLVKGTQADITRTYAVAFTTRAALKQVDQRRVFEAGGQHIVDTKLLYIRYAENRKQVDKDWIIEIGGLEYEIHAKPTLMESGLRLFEILVKAKV